MVVKDTGAVVLVLAMMSVRDESSRKTSAGGLCEWEDGGVVAAAAAVVVGGRWGGCYLARDPPLPQLLLMLQSLRLLL